jgi:hypothetical protein
LRLRLKRFMSIKLDIFMWNDGLAGCWCEYKALGRSTASRSSVDIGLHHANFCLLETRNADCAIASAPPWHSAW